MLATILLGFSAVNTGNNLLFIVVSALLAFMSLTGIIGMQNIKGIDVLIGQAADVTAGSESSFCLRIRNSKKYLPSFVLTFHCRNGVSAPTVFVGAGAETSVLLQISFPRRGIHDFGVITISSPFPVGFFIRSWTYAPGAKIMVFPRPEKGPGMAVPEDDALPGQTTLPSRGFDGELERITGYSGRESRRFIHWKATARTGELMVKEMGSLAAEPLMIDLSAVSPEKIEEEISHAAWLVRKMSGKRPVGLRLADETVPPGTGPAHARRILSRLALIGFTQA